MVFYLAEAINLVLMSGDRLPPLLLGGQSNWHVCNASLFVLKQLWIPYFKKNFKKKLKKSGNL